MGILTTLDQYIDGVLHNGAIKPWMCRSLEVSLEGCPWRGTSVCTRCPFAPPVECGYMCVRITTRKEHVDCEHRAYCKCGWDQSERLRAWGLVE